MEQDQPAKVPEAGAAWVKAGARQEAGWAALASAPVELACVRTVASRYHISVANRATRSNVPSVAQR